MQNPDELFTAQDIAWLKAKGIVLNAPAAALLTAPENTDERASGAGPALALGLFLLLLVSRVTV